MKIGVLALQGDFAKHESILRELNVEAMQIKYPEELKICSGLIIPGGESTTISMQMDYIGIRKKIIDFAKEHPVFGTCAGLVMLSTQLEDSRIQTLDLMDITVSRNAWGRQVHSFVDDVSLSFSNSKPFGAVFIRAPKIDKVGNDITVLSEYQSEPVIVTNGKHLAASFHPELGNDTRIHKYFLELIND
ncbi:MAG: pyridoxal 5'-phosphate synthase glutaminase subunit PdxT [Candidatus Marinimicrobia bacterium]|nr:pyridoxal 5'-phosphate synthase glutaminase subunit PdxT [Candidatus Neomarinimicrobiota bacterium]MBL7022729.1 pyridoxal 5'-phosphate synthase glutaminase subunit PdxT [Candidatus Neomarinimicrobiota bacterium]MBL7109142.1 pyridoxal 5'-phosphate synthase glutaminase subunit PdxT [Candidatus Neomarinimicrobiota bacterium]